MLPHNYAYYFNVEKCKTCTQKEGCKKKKNQKKT